MKITDIKPWIVRVPSKEHGRTHREFVFVQVDTSDGITGWGEVTTYPGPIANRAVCAVLRQMRDLLAGDDTSRIEATWHKVFRAFTYMGSRGMTTAVASGID
ncbi:MAG: mandelate racemase/muconate lactonizing enzyme family protein, partial [Chloroflexota bacterium]|nr:mandelate racemase/muconate lactonizing enzyme family protein [Chloroflexota bacterium]